VPAAIDLEHLCRYTGGDEALNTEILRLYDAQTAELVGRLRSIMDARDAKSWKEITHTLKGAARGVGAFSFAEAAAAAEAVDPIADHAKASIAIATLKTGAEAVQIFIRDYLAR
jgi:HPt (histidine-containing phosphotransfer) domain-containing protein